MVSHDIPSHGRNTRIDRPVVVRWLFSGLFAAVAIWSLSAIAVSLLRSRSDGWGAIAFIGAFGLLFATPFALAAYFCFKRRYGDLFMVGAGVAAFLLLGLGLTIPNELGVMDAVRNWKGGGPWRPPMMLALSVLLLLGPFYLASGFLAVCSRFATRRLPNGGAPASQGVSPGRS